MKRSSKILIAIAAVIGVAVATGAGYWYSIPKEQRNMILFMAGSSEKYEDYEEYQVIQRNEDSLLSSFDTFEAESSETNQDVNIKTVTEMVLNEDSSMLKKGMVQTIGVDDYTGWQVLADEGAAEGEYPFGPSPLNYYTAGLASNLHTQILNAASVAGVVLDSVTVEVMNTFRWDNMSSIDGAGFLDVSSTNII